MDRAAFVGFVRSQGWGVVASLGQDGGPQAAFLAVAATDAGELVFDARASSRKVANVARDPRVAVTVGGTDGTTVQCEGTADVLSGADRRRCAAAYVAAFPQFAGSLLDDGIVLLRVTPVWVRYGDFREGRSVMTVVDVTGWGSTRS